MYILKFPLCHGLDKFREDACAQNIHTRILRLMQYRPNNELLIESAVEVLIIFTELRESSIPLVYSHKMHGFFFY